MTPESPQPNNWRAAWALAYCRQVVHLELHGWRKRKLNWRASLTLAEFSSLGALKWDGYDTVYVPERTFSWWAGDLCPQYLHEAFKFKAGILCLLLSFIARSCIMPHVGDITRNFRAGPVDCSSVTGRLCCSMMFLEGICKPDYLSEYKMMAVPVRCCLLDKQEGSQVRWD